MVATENNRLTAHKEYEDFNGKCRIKYLHYKKESSTSKQQTTNRKPPFLKSVENRWQ